MLRARVCEEEFEEAKKIRRAKTDWSFIEKQPPRVRATLKYYNRDRRHQKSNTHGWNRTGRFQRT